jgi:3-methyladenine DNA glycosylase AlkD
MGFSAEALAEFVEASFQKLANPENAAPMAAYLKTAMPFYGVKKPDRVPVYREMKKRFAPSGRRDYERGVLMLWRRLHREEKYAAIEFARQSDAFIGLESFGLYERLVREGAWWDLVDEVAVRLVGRAQFKKRIKVRRVINCWIDDDDLWVRRTALLSQIRHKEHTNRGQLFRHCLRRAGETGFFIRKAIGWALRDYSYTSPEAVRDFLLANRGRMSGFSFREGAKQLVRSGLLAVDESG